MRSIGDMNGQTIPYKRKTLEQVVTISTHHDTIVLMNGTASGCPIKHEQIENAVSRVSISSKHVDAKQQFYDP
jgi:metal-sulfur cluster biosynthetic enzyme